ncbi:hypothetical protein CNR22_05780 [Sphingobacteriaceae bacterium]|nr:hypothetical protein CNR22_05780 [Sphingobacteriaceae bacterium]
MKIKEDITKQLNDLLEGPLWLDENFNKKLAGLTDDLAFTRPIAEVHSVAELLSHISVWIEACLDRMNCIANTLKDNDENDWKTNEVLRKKGWSVLKKEFYRAHQRLIEYIDTCSEEFLSKKYHLSEFTNKDILFGLIHHDAYHLGQIGITIKLLKVN